MNAKARAQIQFLNNVKRQYPNLYRAALSRTEKAIGLKTAGLGGLGLTVQEMIDQQNAGFSTADLIATGQIPATSSGAGTGFSFQNLLDQTSQFIQQLAPSYIGYKQASQCVEINAARARQGLPPVDCGSAGLAPQVNVGVSKEIQLLVFAGLGLAAVYMFTRKR